MLCGQHEGHLHGAVQQQLAGGSVGCRDGYPSGAVAQAPLPGSSPTSGCQRTSAFLGEKVRLIFYFKNKMFFKPQEPWLQESRGC
jgi:hypothetical protein